MNLKTSVFCFLFPVSCILSTGTHNLGHKAHSTIVENVRQISSFLQNKPNSPIVRMNVTNLTTMNYTIFTSLTKVKNKPNSNPIKANSNPFCQKPKMNANIYYTKVYNNKTSVRREKNKANSNPNKACPERTCPEFYRRSRMDQFQTGLQLMESRKDKLYLTLPSGAGRIRYDTEFICYNRNNEKGFQTCL